jgi:transposase-like protein
LRQVKNRVLTLKRAKSMKKSKFTEAQILKVLKTQEEGKKVSEICREYGISEPTFYNWKSKYGGMTLSELQRVKELGGRPFIGQSNS